MVNFITLDFRGSVRKPSPHTQPTHFSYPQLHSHCEGPHIHMCGH